MSFALSENGAAEKSEKDLYDAMVDRTYVMLTSYYSPAGNATRLMCLKNTDFAEGSRKAGAGVGRAAANLGRVVGALVASFVVIA